ncbi:MAG: hypothetical protein KF708_13345 [Pirellulales bacterium]|nr:hypothetical protein [Pirellulales bacterium]
MIRFRQHTPPPNFLSRREQRRLLVLVLLLGVVVLLIREARDPRRWEWMWRLGSASPSLGSHADSLEPRTSTSGTDSPTIDTRLPPAAPPADGAIVLAPDEVSGQDAHDFFPGVRAELLTRVRDDTPFRGAEHEAWFHLFQILRSAKADQLLSASVGTVDFAQLFQQSADYRGEIVTVRGTVRQALWVEAPKNAAGLPGYYQLALQPLGYQASPIIVYALALPADFPLGETIAADITATGFYFKRWAYPATDTLRLAPVVLVAAVDWQRPVAMTPVVRAGRRSVWFGAGLIVLLLGAGVYLVRRRAPARPSRLSRIQAPDWSQLAGLDAAPPRFPWANEASPPRGEDAP